MTTHGGKIYHSSSKGSVRIGDMALPHLANAWRKLGGDSMAEQYADSLAMRGAIFEEMLERGCFYDANTDQWQFPPKEATP